MAKTVQGGVPPLFVRVVQYVAIVAPLAVPAAETITLDKWHGHTEDHRLTERPRPTGGVVAPLYVPDVTVPVPVLSWHPTYPDRIPPKPEPARTGVTVVPVYLADVTVQAPALSWSPSYPDRVLPKARPVPTGIAVVPVAPVSTVPVPDLVTVIAPDRLPPARVIPAGAVAPLYVPDVTAPVPALSWQPAYPDAARSATRLRDVLTFVAPVAPIAAAPTTPDLVVVVGGGNTAPRRLVLSGSVAPVFVPVVTAGDLIVVVGESPARRIVRSESGVVGPLYVPDVTLVAPPLSWAPTYPDAVRATPPRRGVPEHVGPVETPNTSSLNPTLPRTIARLQADKTMTGLTPVRTVVYEG